MLLFRAVGLFVLFEIANMQVHCAIFLGLEMPFTNVVRILKATECSDSEEHSVACAVLQPPSSTFSEVSVISL